jgi:hypothetical protein
MTDPQPQSLLARYSLDTSFFIDLWSVDVGEFPRDVFKGVWQALESGVTEGKILAPEAVKEELLDTTSAEQKTWVRRKSGMFVPFDMGQVGVTKEIVRAYPKYAEEPKNLADPAVIALAKCGAGDCPDFGEASADALAEQAEDSKRLRGVRSRVAQHRRMGSSRGHRGCSLLI